MQARIFRPAKTAMQSGRAKTRDWWLEFEPECAKRIDPLIGWTGSADMNRQIRLQFPSREAAEAYCNKHGIPYNVEPVHEPKPRTRYYADNFRYDRVIGPVSGFRRP